MNEAAESIAALLALMDESSARRIVAGLASPQKLKLFDRMAATIRARKMLGDGMAVRDVAYRIAGRYAWCFKTAKSRVDAALAMGKR